MRKNGHFFGDEEKIERKRRAGEKKDRCPSERGERWKKEGVWRSNRKEAMNKTLVVKFIAHERENGNGEKDAGRRLGCSLFLSRASSCFSFLPPPPIRARDVTDTKSAVKKL